MNYFFYFADEDGTIIETTAEASTTTESISFSCDALPTSSSSSSSSSETSSLVPSTTIVSINDNSNDNDNAASRMWQVSWVLLVLFVLIHNVIFLVIKVHIIFAINSIICSDADVLEIFEKWL